MSLAIWLVVISLESVTAPALEESALWVGSVAVHLVLSSDAVYFAEQVTDGTLD